VESADGLGAEIAAVLQALGSDDRESNVMLYPGGGSCAVTFLPAVWKKSIAALSSNEGELATSTTT